MSMPDAARFCGACGRSLSIQNPTVPTRFVKTNLRFIPNALQGAVPALGCFAFGVSVLEIVLSVAEEETPVSGALIPLVYYGCWTGLFAALWDGLRRLANPLAPLAGLAAVAHAFAAPFVSGGWCLVNVMGAELGGDEIAELVGGIFGGIFGAVVACVPSSIVLCTQFVFGVALALRHCGHGRTLGIWLAVESVFGAVIEAVSAYMLVGALVGDLDWDDLSGFFTFTKVVSVVIDGIVLFLLCRMLHQALFQETGDHSLPTTCRHG